MEDVPVVEAIMDQNQWWRRVEKVLLGAFEQVDESSRRAYLDLECAGDPDLRREVDGYVLADQAADQADFLEQPVFSIPTAISRLGTTTGYHTQSWIQ